MNGTDGWDALAQRVTRLEELSTFGEREVKQLSDELAELNVRVHELTKRLARLESTMKEKPSENGASVTAE